MQISIIDVDADGKALSTSTTFALCGQVRADGESDDSLNRLGTKAGRECLKLLMLIPGILIQDSSAQERLVVSKVDVS